MPVVGDGTDELQESFLVELVDLSSAGDVVLPAGTAGIGTIVNDDAAPELSVSNVTVDETESEAIFTIELTAASGFDVTVEPPAVGIADVAVVEGDAGMTHAVFARARWVLRVDYPFAGRFKHQHHARMVSVLEKILSSELTIQDVAWYSLGNYRSLPKRS